MAFWVASVTGVRWSVPMGTAGPAGGYNGGIQREIQQGIQRGSYRGPRKESNATLNPLAWRQRSPALRVFITDQRPRTHDQHPRMPSRERLRLRISTEHQNRPITSCRGVPRAEMLPLVA